MEKSRLAALFLLFLTDPTWAQISISSLMEIQRGKTINTDSKTLSTVYEQLNADFLENKIQAGFRAEIFKALGTNRQTVNITQKYISWMDGSAYLVAGNFCTIFGRGLTLRAFEIPNVILESQAYRLRYLPSKDLAGGLASWIGDNIELKALIGRPVKSDIPPGAEIGTPPKTVKRRKEWITGGEIGFRLFPSIKIGGTAVMRNPTDQESSWVWSVLNQINLNPFFKKSRLKKAYFNFYGEYASRTKERGHALYLGGNVGWPKLGLEIEYKDYNNFLLQFNDPPSLVREHNSFLLNRSPHVLLPFNERGYQFEITYTLPKLTTLTANISQGRNDLNQTHEDNHGNSLIPIFTYREHYFASNIEKFLPLYSGTAFYHWGKDELNGISKRTTWGLFLETYVWKNQTLGFDLQTKSATRSTRESQSFNETYAALSFQHSRGYGATLALDRSADPLEIDDPTTLKLIETNTRSWWSMGLTARLSQYYDAVLFLGERRGGTICNSGTCYQILPFKGLEIKISSYF